MKPYGTKPKKHSGKTNSHSSDSCLICSNRNWKISKKAERKRAKEAVQPITVGDVYAAVPPSVRGIEL